MVDLPIKERRPTCDGWSCSCAKEDQPAIGQSLLSPKCLAAWLYPSQSWPDDCERCGADGFNGCSDHRACTAQILQSVEAFPQPSRKPDGVPCGECHLPAGEVCDICGASHPAGAVL